MATVGELVAKITLGGMDTVERQLKRFSQQMSQVSKQAKEMGQKLREAGEGLNEIGENMTPLTAGLAAIGAAGVLASDNLNKGLATFQTKLGATGAELAKYDAVMKEVGATGVGSFEEISNAIVTVAHNMKGLSKADLSAITTEAMHLAEIMGADVGEVTKVAGQLMKQFGVDGKTALDMIAKGYQSGLDYAGDYLDTLQEYSVYFKSLGMSGQDMFNILIQGAQAGAFNLDKVADAVKEFNIRAKDGSKTTAEAFQELGFNAQQMEQTFAKGGDKAREAFLKVVQALAQVDDQAKRNQIGVALFGTQYEDMEKDVIASMGNITNHMKGFEGTASQVAKANKSFAKEMQGAWNEIQVAIKPVGDAIRGAILDVMPYIVSGVKTLASVFSSLSPSIQKAVVVFGAFVAFLPIMIIGLGSISTLLGTFMSGISMITKGFGMLSTAGTKIIGVFKMIGSAILSLGRFLIANPWIALAVGLVTVGILIYKNWDKIVAYTKQVWTSLKAWFAPYWESFKQMVNSVVQAFMSAWDKTKAFFVSLWGKIVQYAQVAWEVIKTIFLVAVGIIVTLLAPIWNAFATVFNACGQVVAKVWAAINAGASALWSAIQSGLNRVKSFFSSVWSAIASIVSAVINRIKSIVQTLVSAVTSVVNRVKSVFSATWNAIYSSVISPVISRIKSLLSSFASTASSIVNRVKSTFSSAWNGIRSMVSSAISSIVSRIQSIWSSASSVASRIKSAFSGIFKGIKLPKFSLSGKFSLMPPSVPKISVSWHAKGGILDSATLIGAGEKGAEAIVPLSSQRRMRPFAQAVARFMPENAVNTGNTTIHVAQLVVREEADIQRIAKELNKLQARKQRAVGGLSFNG